MTQQADQFPSHAIAVVGLAGRFPDADGLEGFWQNIVNGVESLETFSDTDLDIAGVPAEMRSNPAFVRRGTVLADIDLFDAAFFGLSPREAQILDPQQRLFLECAWEALEHAGYAADTAERSVGVYAGASMNTYLLTQILRAPEVIAAVGNYQIMLGSDKDFLCTRASYKLNLRGPSVTVQTACSTSLVAVVMASQALSHAECDLALAGGVSLAVPQRAGYLYEPGMILSPDGHCRPFDARAGGTRAGSGCGIVVLKRLADALADRDTIHAVIRGAAINNDGGAKAGYTAPSVDGQVEVIATAQALAGIEARQVSYLEAHGTATPLGDPIEIAALTQVFRDSTPDIGFCRLGSLKANLGHLDAAAGVAGLIKTVLALEHRTLPPLVNFEQPNPQLQLGSSPFVASASSAAWTSAAAPRRAGVSSFGIGGTNAHVVLEEAPSAADRVDVPDAHLLILSARSASALEQMSSNLLRHLSTHPEIRLDDVERTLQVGRRSFPHRRALIVRNRAHALELLSQVQGTSAMSAEYEGAARPVAFLFAGQGSQHAGMGARLYATEAVYQSAIDECARILQPHLGEDIRQILSATTSAERINRTQFAQPALFVAEYALARLWISWGIEPAAMLGHSIGEYVAAHLAGVMSLETSLAIVAARGRLMQALPAGSMAAVALPEATLRARLLPGVEIAAINAPSLCTIAGGQPAIEALLRELQAQGVEGRALHTSHAFHSAAMEPAMAPFARLLQGVALSAPRIPYVSNLSGTWITAAEATSPAYYADHLRHAVRFESGLRTLTGDPTMLLLEVGPGTALTAFARATLGSPGAARAVASMPRIGDARSELEVIRESIGRLWLMGATPDFERMHVADGTRRIPLPTYPFERKRHWIEAALFQASASTTNVLRPLDDWFYAPAWKRDDAPVTARVSGTWLVLGQRDALTDCIVRALAASGARAVLVEASEGYTRIGEEHYSVRRDSAADLTAVCSATDAGGAIHLWGTDGYQALVALGQALSADGREAPAKILHVTCGQECVLDESVPAPRNALALGPVLVLPTELPGLRMRCIDLEGRDGAVDLERATRDLIAEASIDDASNRSAWRGSRRWLRQWDRIAAPESSPTGLPFKVGGVYVITGGLGGIGLGLAEWLARRFQARLLLLSCADIDSCDASSSRAAIRTMEGAGAEVMAASADVADEAATAMAIAQARQRWGRIDGLIHAAGISGSNEMAVQVSRADAEAVIAPKAGGIEVLSRVLGADALDVTVLMSSINAILGNAGACADSAANAVLDSFVDSSLRPVGWRHVVSINWGPWSEIGMAADYEIDDAMRERSRAHVATGIPTQQGIEAFERAVASGRSHIAVVAADLLASFTISQRAASAGGDARHTDDAPTTVKSIGASRNGERDPPESQLERRLAAIWAQVLGIESVGRNEDFFALGGHSLVATRVMAQVQQAFGRKLELREIFAAPTIAQLARLLESEAVSENEPVAAASQEEREEFEF